MLFQFISEPSTIAVNKEAIIDFGYYIVMDEKIKFKYTKCLALEGNSYCLLSGILIQLLLLVLGIIFNTFFFNIFRVDFRKN